MSIYGEPAAGTVALDGRELARGTMSRSANTILICFSAHMTPRFINQLMLYKASFEVDF